jgi:Uma2 family endonuclease
MTQAAHKPYTYAEYLALEEKSTDKHEYYQGEVFVMSGGTPAHSEIAINVAGSLREALRNYPYHIYGSDLRVRIEAIDYSTYGDVMVVCSELQYYQNRPDVITNPLLIVEVLSSSTRNFDQNKKFEFYRTIPSFEHYLIIDPERLYVEYHQKSGYFWLASYLNQSDQIVSLKLPHTEVALPLTLIYEKITFPPPAP